MPAEFDPVAFGTSQDPYPAIHALRAEDPVHWNSALKSWVLTRYDDVRHVLLTPKIYSEDRVRPFLEALSPEKRGQLTELDRVSAWLPFLSGQAHHRVRVLTMTMFSPKKIRAMEPTISTLADDLIDGFIERGSANFFAEFAMLLPGYVIMDLLGTPREDLFRAKAWADVIGAFMGGKALPDKYRRVNEAVIEMTAYFQDLVAARKDARGMDVVSQALSAHENDKLSVEELIGLCSVIIFAGHETTTALLTAAMVAFARHPDQRQKLLDHPELIETAIDELLRVAGPEGGLVRIVMEDHELKGKLLRKGDRVFAMTTGANRDPAHFSDPDRFDITRKGVGHFAFGYGAHVCLGMWLAKLETRIAIPKLLTRLGDYTIDQTTVNYGGAGMSRSLQGLAIKFKPGPKIGVSAPATLG
jgi:cytochrome P450